MALQQTEYDLVTNMDDLLIFINAKTLKHLHFVQTIFKEMIGYNFA